jgi:hypothetical protein
MNENDFLVGGDFRGLVYPEPLGISQARCSYLNVSQFLPGFGAGKK